MEVLRIGARELAPFLEPHGFEFVQTNAGPSGGGPFAELELEREMEYFVEPEEAFTRDEIE